MIIEIVLKWVLPIVLTAIFGLTSKVINDMKTQKMAITSLLRSEMVKVYYKYKNEKRMPHYIKEAWYEDYEAYKKLGGNSFIDNIKNDIEEWEVE